MPTIAWIFTLLAVLALAIASVLGLAGRVLGLQTRLQSCESALAQLERTERLTPSKLAELGELREAVSRADALLVKVNRREIAAAKRRDDAGQFAGSNGADKDELRRRAGLRAGEPARHQ